MGGKKFWSENFWELNGPSNTPAPSAKNSGGPRAIATPRNAPPPRMIGKGEGAGARERRVRGSRTRCVAGGR